MRRTTALIHVTFVPGTLLLFRTHRRPAPIIRTMARRRLEFVAMTSVSLVVAHNLVFVLGYGAAYGEALSRTGHGDAWQTAVITVLGAGAGLLGVALWRLYRLGLLARAHGHRAAGLRESRVEAVDPGVARLWGRLTAATASLFLVQENVEHLLSGHQLPGLSVLGSAEYPDALLVIGAVALVVALVGSLIRWRRAVLTNRIAAAIRRLRFRRVATLRRPHADPDRRPGTILGRVRALRAPPLLPVT
jgi:hypothetical protein